MVIAIVVTYFTAGAASGLVAGAASTAGATTATAAGGMWAAGTGASLAGAGWANVAVTSALTGMASNTVISTINTTDINPEIIGYISEKTSIYDWEMPKPIGSATDGLPDWQRDRLTGYPALRI